VILGEPQNPHCFHNRSEIGKHVSEDLPYKLIQIFTSASESSVVDPASGLSDSSVVVE